MRFLITSAASLLLTRYTFAYVVSPYPLVSEIALPTIADKRAPTAQVEQVDPNDCSTDTEACDETANSAHKSCTKATDCVAYCHGLLGNEPDVGSTCAANMNPETHLAAGSICSCYNSTGVADMATEANKGIGETVCFVVDLAYVMTEDVIKAALDAAEVADKVITEVPELEAFALVAKWGKKLFKYGDKILAHGDKIGKCPNVACEYHEFTVIDSKKIIQQLGALSPCNW